MKNEDKDLPLYDGSNNDDESNYDDNFEDNQLPNIEELPDCPLTDVLLNSLVMPKPLGYMFPQEKMEEFLKNRGYRIIKRYSESRGQDYNVAVKAGSSSIPEDDYSNVREIFDNEVQDILLSWLLKIGKEA